MRVLVAMMAVPFALLGCKGHAPAALTGKTSTTITGTVGRAGKPGSFAPDFVGTVVFGPPPTANAQPHQIYVVTHFSPTMMPAFFLHNRFQPQVRWVQYWNGDYVDKALKAIRERTDKDDPAEELTVMSYDPKTQSQAWAARGAYVIAQDGIIQAICSDEDLEKKLGLAVRGKLDVKVESAAWSKRMAIESMVRLKWRDYWDAYTSKSISFGQFRDGIANEMRSDPPEAAASMGGIFLGSTEFDAAYRAKTATETDAKVILDLLRNLPRRADALASAINFHREQREYRGLVLAELQVALTDPEIANSPYLAADFAMAAIMVKQKQLALKFANMIMPSKQLRQRWAKQQREYYEAEYDDLVYRANHIQPD